MNRLLPTLTGLLLILLALLLPGGCNSAAVFGAGWRMLTRGRPAN